MQLVVRPCKGIHEGPGFRIPASRFRIPHLDSGFQSFRFRIPTFWISYQSGFRIPNHCGFRILVVSGFRIPTANICWIPDSGFSYMGRRGGDFLCFWSILGQFSRDFRLFARAAPYSNVFLPVSNDSILT